MVLTSSNEGTEGQRRTRDDVSVPWRRDGHQAGNLDLFSRLQKASFAQKLLRIRKKNLDFFATLVLPAGSEKHQLTGDSIYHPLQATLKPSHSRIKLSITSSTLPHHFIHSSVHPRTLGVPIILSMLLSLVKKKRKKN